MTQNVAQQELRPRRRIQNRTQEEYDQEKKLAKIKRDNLKVHSYQLDMKNLTHDSHRLPLQTK